MNLFVTAFQVCKNVEDAKDVVQDTFIAYYTSEDSNLFEAVMHLPEKYRIVIHLFYYEDWNIREISEILHTSVSNVKVRLSRGRTLLKNVLKEEWADDE